jgi:hypothetical protein
MDEQGNRTIQQSSSLLTVIVFFVLLFVFAKWGPAINFSTTSQSKGEPLIVSGEGKVFVTPDIAKLSFGIEESGASLKTLQNSVNQKSNTLTESLRKLGVKEEDIKTSSYSVFPEYDYTNPGSRITGFRVSISYLVTIRDFDKVNDAIVAGTASGANMIGGISFEVNDETEKEKLNEARKIAVTEAKEKAQGLANAAEITLGRIINISEGFDNAPQPIRLMATGDTVAEKAIAEPDIQPGETEINVTVSLSYEVR